MAREFFRGTTQAGRALALFFEHTTYDTFTDNDGNVVHNPAETSITATLDGAPIEVERVNWGGGTATVSTREHGTFTATTRDDAEAHKEALRRYLEHRPSGGWEVAILDKGVDGEDWRYTVAITNGRLTEHVEFRLSQQVAKTLARGRDLPPDDAAVIRELSFTVRSDTWQRIIERAAAPTTLEWIAHPS